MNEEELARLIRSAWDEQPPDDLERLVGEAERRLQAESQALPADQPVDHPPRLRLRLGSLRRRRGRLQREPALPRKEWQPWDRLHRRSRRWPQDYARTRPTSGPSREPSTRRGRGPVIELRLPYVAVMLVLLSLLLYAYQAQLATWSRLPYQSVADVLMTSAIVVLTFEWFLRRENEAQLSEIVRDTVHQELGPLARSFFSEPQVLLKALGEPALDEVISKALGIRLEDPTLAAEVDSGLLQTIARYKERWNNARFTVTLTRVQDDPSRAVRDRYFQAYVGLRLEMVLTRSEFPVWCVSSKEAYGDVLWGDQDFFYAWLQPPTREFPEVSESSFEVESIAVDGTRLGICTTKNLDPRRMLVVCRDDFLGSLLGQQVIVEATFRVKVPKRAHSLNLSVVAPTRGVLMALFYGDTDVHRVEVTDMFVSSRRPEIRELPTSTRPRAVEVQLREWAFPKGGVVFNWHLEQEQTQHFDELLADPDQH